MTLQKTVSRRSVLIPAAKAYAMDEVHEKKLKVHSMDLERHSMDLELSYLSTAWENAHWKYATLRILFKERRK